MKQKPTSQTYWAAVKVVRGFVDEVQLFATINAALKRKDHWRPSLNPDYDEVAVIKTRVQRPAPSR